ncbi:hypothetical protein NE237_001486 [Protea cynaroides]|uniref:Uncharacterized protein n=1 Tax=Protea cynaroides TaxID=273540 RepID=A0A9Q0QYI0_9MAGN|nr:hypothetical protein NE237_001486 [Protea cynaroides]
MGCRMKLVFLGFLLLLSTCSTTDGAVSTSIMKKIREVNKKGHYLGIVVPNFFEMSPLLQSSSFVADEKLPYVDFSGPHTTDIINDFHQQIKQEHYLLGDISDEAAEAMENSKWISIKASINVATGTVVAAAFADPLLDALLTISPKCYKYTFILHLIHSSTRRY